MTTRTASWAPGLTAHQTENVQMSGKMRARRRLKVPVRSAVGALSCVALRRCIQYVIARIEEEARDTESVAVGDSARHGVALREDVDAGEHAGEPGGLHAVTRGGGKKRDD